MNALFGRGSDRQMDIGLAVLRAVVGIIFIAHGGQKLFVYGLEGVGGGFAQMGVPMAAVVGPFIAFLEFFGGIALVLGLLTRVASLGLAFTMVGAIVLVHLKEGFFNPAGIEFPLLLLAAAVTLVITGAGRYSLDGLIAGRRARAEAPVRAQPSQVRRVA